MVLQMQVSRASSDDSVHRHSMVKGFLHTLDYPHPCSPARLREHRAASLTHPNEGELATDFCYLGIDAQTCSRREGADSRAFRAPPQNAMSKTAKIKKKSVCLPSPPSFEGPL